MLIILSPKQYQVSSQFGNHLEMTDCEIKKIKIKTTSENPPHQGDTYGKIPTEKEALMVSHSPIRDQIAGALF